MLWEQCPQEFRRRYVDGEALETTEAMAFGQAIHQGLEAHYQGLDGERAFRRAWKATATPDAPRRLTVVGLELLEQAFALDLRGVPERGFSVDTEADLGAPIVGAIDLWGADNVIYDFKTTRGLWSQARAEREVWQPLLYTWARWLDEPSYEIAFEYIVLNRVTGTLERFRREWTHEEWLDQMSCLHERMRTIAGRLHDGDFSCPERHGQCPECGGQWGHDHDCEGTAPGLRIRL